LRAHDLAGPGESIQDGFAERLQRKGVTTLNKIQVDTEPGQLQQMTAKTGRRTVPQIFIDELHVGGFDDLSALDRSGRLGELLAG
jgi:glutaredoxin 3